MSKAPEDPLEFLPCSNILTYEKGEVIYDQESPSNNLFLIIDGKVKLCWVASDNRKVVADIYMPDELFGESAFVGLTGRSETAEAIESTHVMAWTINELEELALHRPKLAIALIQLLVRRSLDLGTRIESCSFDSIERRLARALIRFSERLGKQTEGGSVQMIPFTHSVLAQYIGTSREIVTRYMNQFRREGLLRYSRQGILLNGDGLRDWLCKDRGVAA